ncbi:MAG TPA: chemotaxis protein CheW [Longimicrobiales bacterium]|nr:chemotaxis protein CheW [Longimicrobiales bacterium]
MTRYLVVEAGGERWALPSEAVAEVVEEPEVQDMPALPDRVRGVLSHRGEWLPVLDLARALDLGTIEGAGSALVMDRGRTHYALLVERALDAVEREEEERSWSDEDGVVTRLDVDELFQAPPPPPAPGGAPVAAAATTRSVVCFRIADAELAFPADDVDRIWPYENPEPVPGLPDYVLGVLHLRGFTMPVLDLGRHLGLSPRGGEERRVLILGSDDKRVGWVVDEVLAVAEFPAERWMDLPGYFAGRSARLIAAVVSREEGRPMLVLHADELLDPDQRVVLQGSPHAG